MKQNHNTIRIIILMTILASVGSSFAADKQPNIVLLFIDDMGWKDAAYAGSDFYETPNIDQLAQEGMVFTDCYAGAGNCAPSRACMLSGQYTPRHGLYAVGNTTRGPKEMMRLTSIPNASGLSSDCVTFAEALKKAGYVTGHFGKWHLNNSTDPDGTSPSGQGFDFAYAPDRKFSKTKDPKSIFGITNAACEFIESNRDRPFFAYVAHHAIHMPIQATDDSTQKFAEKEPGERHVSGPFAAMIENMDQSVGKVLKTIDKLGLRENTLVLFTSDNGGLPLSTQAPLRAFKGAYYEGGIRVPMIASWTGTIQPGTTCDVPVHNVDFYPTFLDLADERSSDDKQLDGESLLPLFTQTRSSTKRNAIFWYFPGYLNSANPGSRDGVFRTPPVAVMRQGDWKIHLFLEEWVLDGGWEKRDSNNAIEIYHLGKDVAETNNLAASNQKKRDELLKGLLEWMKVIDAQVPSQANDSYKGALVEPKPRTKKRQPNRSSNSDGKQSR